MNFTLSLLAEGQQAAAGGMNNTMLIVLMVGFIAFFYFAVVMPQNKKKKEMDRMLSDLKKGDKVITIGGIHGKVSTVKDNEITIKVDANTEITFEKSAISRVANNSTVTAKKSGKQSKDEKKDDDPSLNKALEADETISEKEKIKV